MAEKDYKKLCEEYEKKLGLGESDISYKAYIVLVKVNQQIIDFLDGFQVHSKISGKASEDATFARAQSLWEGLPKMVKDLNEMKLTLKVEPLQDNGPQVQRMTPESAAGLNGKNV